eukprot:scaffold46291_cov67-Phaeocystis_antarctica.AAC.6
MSRAAKKQKTVELPKLPKISDALDGPVVQTLATVCNKLYDPALFTVFKPKNGEPDDQLDQPYEMVTKSGAYKEGGVYSADDSSYTGGDGALVSGYDIFNKDTTQVVEGKTCGSQSLAEYGTVIDGFTDFLGEAWTPPFAALIVQPKDKKEVRASYPKPPRTLPRPPAERECCAPPAGPHPHPRLARIYHDNGLGQRCRGHSHSLYATTRTVPAVKAPQPRPLA